MSYGDGIKNAVIKSASLTTADHGCLSAWRMLDYGGSGQGFGGYSLASTNMKREMKPSFNWAGIHITSILRVAGVSEWSSLPGKTIRVDVSNGIAKGIGHILKDDWFYPGELADKLTNGAGND